MMSILFFILPPALLDGFMLQAEANFRLQHCA
jgi:hypothetical protein